MVKQFVNMTTYAAVVVLTAVIAGVVLTVVVVTAVVAGVAGVFWHMRICDTCFRQWQIFLLFFRVIQIISNYLDTS